MLWYSLYETGVDEIDRQNFELIDRVKVMMNIEDNKERLKQLEIFEELVKKYFAREQRLHEEFCYLDAYWHRVFHEAYIRKLQHAKQRFIETGATLENEKIFITQVVEFLKNHIACHDRSFAHFYYNSILCENFFGHENANTQAAV